MHIVILSPSWPRHDAANGIVTYCDNVVKSLKAQGHDVSVLARRRAVNSKESEAASAYIDEYSPTLIEKLLGYIGEFFSTGFSQYYLGGRAILSGVRNIEKNKKIDVLEMEESFGWHFFLQRRVEFPVVMRLHGPHYINCMVSGGELSVSDTQRFKREERAFRAAHYVNAPSQWVLDEPQKTYHIKWPVQAAFFNPLAALPVDQCWSPSSYTPKQLLFVGRFDVLKGGDFIIKTFAKIIEHEPDATLVFAGPDKGIKLASGGVMYIKDAIEAYIPEGKRGHVRYVGLTDSDTISLLRRQSHVALMASRSETLGYAVLESLAAAAPIVAPYVAGVRETFENNVSGVFFEEANSDDMAEKVLALLRNPFKAESISQFAYERCQSAFSPTSVASEATKFYLRAVGWHAKK
jgi:glycosyltransferase involved in cell wall biosynthesis